MHLYISHISLCLCNKIQLSDPTCVFVDHRMGTMHKLHLRKEIHNLNHLVQLRNVTGLWSMTKPSHGLCMKISYWLQGSALISGQQCRKQIRIGMASLPFPIPFFLSPPPPSLPPFLPFLYPPFSPFPSIPPCSLPSVFSAPVAFPEKDNLIPARGSGEVLKSTLVHFSLKVWHLVGRILMIFLSINCPNFIGLVWRCHTKFQIGMAVAIPLPAPLRAGIGP